MLFLFLWLRDIPIVLVYLCRHLLNPLPQSKACLFLVYPLPFFPFKCKNESKWLFFSLIVKKSGPKKMKKSPRGQHVRSISILNWLSKKNLKKSPGGHSIQFFFGTPGAGYRKTILFHAKNLREPALLDEHLSKISVP